MIIEEIYSIEYMKNSTVKTIFNNGSIVFDIKNITTVIDPFPYYHDSTFNMSSNYTSVDSW